MRSNVWVDDATFLTLAQSMNECIFSQSCAITPIPKIAHFIWLGSNRLPDYAELFIARFRSLHPHWRVIVWDDSAADSFPWAKNKAFFDESSNWGM